MRVLRLYFLLVLLYCLTILEVNAQEGWRGIVPLVTTRDEVEKKLGSPSKFGFYELDEGKVYIDYVETNCGKILRCDCLVAQGTVQSIRIEIYYDLYLKDVNVKRFKKTRNSHHPNVVTYSNEKTGITYEVQNKLITHINYYESMKNCKNIEQNN